MRRFGKVYLIGEALSPGLRSAEPAVRVAGDRVTIWYATPGDVETWGGRTLREVDISVQVRHQPGTEVPELTLEEGRGSGLHPRLQAWVDRSR